MKKRHIKNDMARSLMITRVLLLLHLRNKSRLWIFSLTSAVHSSILLILGITNIQ